MLHKFTIECNKYLRQDIRGYYNTFYRKFNKPENPDFINILKNTYNEESPRKLEEARKQAVEMLMHDLPLIREAHDRADFVVVAIPRAKELESYAASQLQLIKAISIAACSLGKGFEDGTEAIHRHTDTRTTHLKPETKRTLADGTEEENTGELPYPGITRETCTVDARIFAGKNVILVDDIYTKTVNIDEDCIQTLLDFGAKQVIFYALAHTKRMNYSVQALRALLAQEAGYNTCKRLWDRFPSARELDAAFPGTLKELKEKNEALLERLDYQGVDGFICPFDPEFPQIPRNVTPGNWPYLLFYRGDIRVLKSPVRVSVIGTTAISDDVELRERNLVSKLVDRGVVIVSGLALGCDSVSHKCCMEENGKTIAIIPSTIGAIVPKENRDLADEIVNEGGLIITEYRNEPQSAFDQKNRYVKRDRLQAYFSRAVILISSYRKDEGDSGSRYALEAAGKTGVRRYVMYNKASDAGAPQFGMNKDMLQKEPELLLKHNTIDFICSDECQPDMSAAQEEEQPSLFD